MNFSERYKNERLASPLIDLTAREIVTLLTPVAIMTQKIVSDKIDQRKKERELRELDNYVHEDLDPLIHGENNKMEEDQ
jgi:hypothetical protein